MYGNRKSLVINTRSYQFDTHGSVHRRLLSINNKMQLCNRIYYSNVFWRLNMFWAAHCSSSGALNCICSVWFIYPYGARPLPRLWQRPLETCWAFKKLWNNKFYYKAASCWYFNGVIYDARIHEYQIYQFWYYILISLCLSEVVLSFEVSWVSSMCFVSHSCMLLFPPT